MADEEHPLLSAYTPNPPRFCQWVNPFQGPRIARSRAQLRRFFTSRAGHYSILLLVSLDVSCIFAGILILYLLDSRNSNSSMLTLIDFIINLFTCEARSAQSAWNTALEALGIVSLVFSCLFMVELLASIWAFGAA